ncbi:MAG: heavy-metal-associated domain-containing protein [Calditrichaeota bacterium]|nr:heavy-metal-associated domain-containing protein [Calditrichota bacterium]
MTTLTSHLNVLGMHCHGCERSVENAIKRLPGVVSAKADAMASKVEVASDQPLDPDAVRKAVESAGYMFAGNQG